MSRSSNLKDYRKFINLSIKVFIWVDNWITMKRKIVIASLIVLILLIGGYFYLQTPIEIEINEISKIVLIDKNYRPITLKVTGVDSTVRVTSTTEVSKVELGGIRNIVVLCEGSHDPEVRVFGISSDVAFINC